MQPSLSLTALLGLIALMLALHEVRAQFNESDTLERLAKSLRTGKDTADIRQVMAYVYTHICLGPGKRGALRASALEALNPKIGGQCGEFARVAVNLFHYMGYPARRVYLFRAAGDGREFDPVRDRSFHVMVEVQANGRWIAGDPFHGLVFEKPGGDLATLTEVSTDRAIIEHAHGFNRIVIRRTIEGFLEVSLFSTRPEDYQNPHRFNWLYVARLPGLFPLARALWHDKLNQVYVPLILEQPHALMAAFLLCTAALMVLSGFAQWLAG